MNVRELRQHLSDLAKVLTAAKASASVTGDLAAICDGLVPFEQLPLKTFAEFLGKCDAYSRGEVPIKGGAKSQGTKSPRQNVDVDGLKIEISDLYEHASMPSTTTERIEAAMAKCNLADKNALVMISEAIGLTGLKSKTKPLIIKAIRQMIMGRKGSTQRSETTDRPATNRDGASSPVVNPIHSFAE